MDIQRVETYMKRVAESETKTFTPVGDKLKVGLDLGTAYICLLYTSPSPRDTERSRMPSSA